MKIKISDNQYYIVISWIFIVQDLPSEKTLGSIYFFTFKRLILSTTINAAQQNQVSSSKSTRIPV